MIPNSWVSARRIRPFYQRRKSVVLIVILDQARLADASSAAAAPRVVAASTRPGGWADSTLAAPAAGV
jgi:hypothetical protein